MDIITHYTLSPRAPQGLISHWGGGGSGGGRGVLIHLLVGMLGARAKKMTKKKSNLKKRGSKDQSTSKMGVKI